MNTEEKNKMLALLAAITAQVPENMSEELSEEDYQILVSANEVAWKYRENRAEEFYYMAKQAEKATGFSK
jgi:hypothetical protein